MTGDPFARLAVEFLARTGLRRGEFLNLTVDSVVQIGAAYWLHVPLGKLRTDRYIPLHPRLKGCWTSGSPADRRICGSRGCSWTTAGGDRGAARAQVDADDDGLREDLQPHCR